MEINKLVQLNGKYIMGSITKNVATIDSLHIINSDHSKKNKFTRPELDELIKELQIVRNQLEGVTYRE